MQLCKCALRLWVDVINWRNASGLYFLVFPVTQLTTFLLNCSQNSELKAGRRLLIISVADDGGACVFLGVGVEMDALMSVSPTETRGGVGGKIRTDLQTLPADHSGRLEVIVPESRQKWGAS